MPKPDNTTIRFDEGYDEWQLIDADEQVLLTGTTHDELLQEIEEEYSA